VKALHLGALRDAGRVADAALVRRPGRGRVVDGIERTHGRSGLRGCARMRQDMGVPVAVAPWVGVYGCRLFSRCLRVALGAHRTAEVEARIAVARAARVMWLLPPLPAFTRGTDSARADAAEPERRGEWTPVKN